MLTMVPRWRFVRMWSVTDPDDGVYDCPGGLAVDPRAGRVYVSDGENHHRIQVFSLTGTRLAAWGTKPLRDYWFPRQLAVTRTGGLIVLDSGNNRVKILDAEGNVLAMWGEEGKQPGQMDNPCHFALTEDEHLLIAERHGRVDRYTLEGTFVESWGREGRRSGEFLVPDAIVIGPDGLVYTTEIGTGRVQRFTPHGEFRGMLDRERGWVAEAAPKQFARPTALAFDAQGRCYVVCNDQDAIQVFSSEGLWLTTLGSSGHTAGEFDSPNDIVLTPDGMAYVADVMNYRIQVFRLDG